MCVRRTWRKNQTYPRKSNEPI